MSFNLFQITQVLLILLRIDSTRFYVQRLCRGFGIEVQWRKIGFEKNFAIRSVCFRGSYIAHVLQKNIFLYYTATF